MSRERIDLRFNNIKREIDAAFYDKNAFVSNEDEFEYLNELAKTQKKMFDEQQEQIEKQMKVIEYRAKVRNTFDVSRIKELPTDIVNEITSYLETETHKAELDYTRKFYICKKFIYEKPMWWDSRNRNFTIHNVLKTIIKENIKKYYLLSYTEWNRVKNELIDLLEDRFKEIVCERMETMDIDKIFFDMNSPIVNTIGAPLRRYTENYVKALDGIYKAILTFEVYLKYRRECMQRRHLQRNRET